MSGVTEALPPGVVIVEDSEKLASTLDQALDDSAKATRDPWKEREAPATVNQFRSALPVVG